MKTADAILIARGRALAQSGQAQTIRRAAGLSQEDVAKIVGTTKAAVNRWESGTRIPRPELAIRLARLLDELQRVTYRGPAVTAARERLAVWLEQNRELAQELDRAARGIIDG